MIPLGTNVKPYGKVSAVGCIQGERYYWLLSKEGVVSMIPADFLELEGGEHGTVGTVEGT
jgi:hypothetical protein